MPLDEIRLAIKAAIEGVPTVGVVTDFEPYANREEDFRTYFKSPTLDYVLGWTITRTETSEEWATDRDNLATHGMVIRGYRVVGRNSFGATERDFQDLVEAVTDALRAGQRTKFGGVPGLSYVAPPQVRVVEVRQFADCLAHYAEIGQGCGELLQISRP